MKTCKLMPNGMLCEFCSYDYILLGVMDKCSVCRFKTERFELLDVGSGRFNEDYARVVIDGFVEDIPIVVIYDVREG